MKLEEEVGELLKSRIYPFPPQKVVQEEVLLL